MTIDEAIKHCEEVVAKYEKQAANSMSKEGKEYNCECAADHRQLAEWLKELKELKSANVQPIKHGLWLYSGRYLTSAYEDMYYFTCSICGEDSLDEGEYCSHCGAVMDNA